MADSAGVNAVSTVATERDVQHDGRNTGRRGGRGGRGGRGRGRGRGRGSSAVHHTQHDHGIHSQPLVVNGGGAAGRAFGGQLTRLDAQANSFTPASIAPGSSTNSKSATNRRRQQQQQHNTPVSSSTSSTAPHGSHSVSQRPRRFSRSTAPDIVTRLHEDIAHGIYECAICTNEVARNSKVWSCHTCWTVFHLSCIKKWSKNEGSAVQQQRGQPQDATETPIGKQWRCPGCNLPKDVSPSAYQCWCEKELDPKIISGLPPHSCGQTCGRDRKFPKACPHPCDQICHAGPCPPCTSVGPKQSCFCGKQATTRRCIDTEYEAGWSCGAVCGDMMPCGDHTCQRQCHEGLCGACDVRVDATCYCGKVEQQMMCSEQEEEKESYSWTGVFDCRQTCDRTMDCGIHRCEQTCHPQDEPVPHCPKSPDVVTRCPCGKTPLQQLPNGQRGACTDPIPSCQKTCDKVMNCGHACPRSCHTGDCPPCVVKVPLTCRCGRNKFETSCFGGSKIQPQCFRTCKATLNCGRHECGERCCTGEKKAAERQATKRKLKPLGAARLVDDGIEAEHICTRVCGRQLKCGNHTCPELCHKGPCGSCREAIFDDISCDCGRTTLQAPLPCGTRPPPCSFPCHRAKTCGHPQVVHNCHLEEESCPKCPFLTEKKCLCAKKTLKNQPCWRSDVLCGLICGKMLKCGSHLCRKTCHKPGECADAQLHCQQECGKAKKTCGHPCEQPCHAPSACKEEKACPFKVMITCDCQRKKEEVRCNARANVPDPAGRQNSLKCDDECARLERNRKLATALHISDDHTDDHIPYSNETLQRYLSDATWAHKQEEILRVFAADDTERRYRFPPMKPHQRTFLHLIAEDFGFDGESLDPEPHRHVVLFKTPKFVAAPMKTLAQAARIRRAQLSITAPVHVPAGNVVTEKRADEALSQDFNGILLRDPRFGLTEDELKPTIASAAPSVKFNIHFLSNSDAVALVPQSSPSNSPGTSHAQLGVLKTLLPSISAAIVKAKLANVVLLAAFELPPNDTTNAGVEPKLLFASDAPSAVSAGGWSQVASSSSSPYRANANRTPGRLPGQPEPVGQRTMYTVLGSRLAEMKRRKVEEEKEMKRKRKEMERQAATVEDWSVDAEADEVVEAGEGVGGVGAVEAVEAVRSDEVNADDEQAGSGEGNANAAVTTVTGDMSADVTV